MKFIVVAEKGNVAKIIERVLSRYGVNLIALATNGHVMDSELPVGYEWGKVDPKEIFDVVGRLRMVVRRRKVYNRLRKVFMRTNGVLVVATDNDPEGELIGFEILMIYRRVRRDARYFRMRFNSVDEKEILRAWRNLEKELNWRWVYKALFRQKFDLVTGAAFTRFLTSLTRKHVNVKLVSWGSCQTPTLYFVVEREREIERFKPETYWYLEAKMRSGDYIFSLRTDRIWSQKEAIELFVKVRPVKFGKVVLYREVYSTIQRPLPLMTDYLLKDISRITGLSASRILNIAEELYSSGYISYPRTETDIYRKDFDFNAPLQAVLLSDLGPLIKPFISYLPRPRNGRHDDQAHPPIYPLKPYPLEKSNKRVIWEYVARRFIANAFTSDAKLCVQKVEVEVGGIIFKTIGQYLSEEGFYRVYPYFKPKEKRLPKLREGELLEIVNIKLCRDKTKPPARLSEANLIELMVRNGIGTDATRAMFPKIITERGYSIKRKGRFIPTKLGRKFIEALELVDKKLVTPETRRYVEELMRKIELGQISMEEALNEAIRKYKELFELCERKSDFIEKILVEGCQA